MSGFDEVDEALHELRRCPFWRHAENKVPEIIHNDLFECAAHVQQLKDSIDNCEKIIKLSIDKMLSDSDYKSNKRYINHVDQEHTMFVNELLALGIDENEIILNESSFWEYQYPDYDYFLMKVDFIENNSEAFEIWADQKLAFSRDQLMKLQNHLKATLLKRGLKGLNDKDALQKLSDYLE
jgi:hypothetical protein